MLKISWLGFEKVLNGGIDILKSESREEGHYYKCLSDKKEIEFLVSNLYK